MFFNTCKNTFSIAIIIFKGKIKGEINVKYLRVVLFQFIRLNLLNLIIQNCEGLILSFAIKNSEEEKSDYSFVSQNFSLLLRFFIEPVTDGFYILVNKLKYMEKKVEVENNNINKDKDKDKDNEDEEIEEADGEDKIEEDDFDEDFNIGELTKKKIESEKKNEENENIGENNNIHLLNQN